MSDRSKQDMERRRFVKLLGGSVVAVPIASLAGCSKGAEAPAAADRTVKDAAVAAKPPAPANNSPASAPAAPADMPRLEEDDQMAVSLNYHHDASKVDRAKNPLAGEVNGELKQCDNCALYLAKGDEEWAGCSIFPGKLVNAKGWCSVWAPKA